MQEQMQLSPEAEKHHDNLVALFGIQKPVNEMLKYRNAGPYFVDYAFTNGRNQLSDIAEREDGYSLWLGVCLYFINMKRWTDLVAVCLGAVKNISGIKRRDNKWYHLGWAYVFLSDAYRSLGFNAISQYYLFLAAVDDTIRAYNNSTDILSWKDLHNSGHDINIHNPNAGIYPRLVMRDGWTNYRLDEFSLEVVNIIQTTNTPTLFPEYYLQKIGYNYFDVKANTNELYHNLTNIEYADHLIQQLNKTGSAQHKGQLFEIVCQYILSSTPGVSSVLRVHSKTTEYDILAQVLWNDNHIVNIRHNRILGECKCLKNKAGVTVLFKFGQVLKSIGLSLGILFVANGISKQSELELYRIYASDRITILVITYEDLLDVIKGKSMGNMIKKKCDQIRFMMNKE